MKKIVLLLFFTFTLGVQALHWSGTKLYDLEFQGPEFIKEANLWVAENSPLSDPSIKTTQCLQDIVLGGPSIFQNQLGASWSRTYDLPAHQAVSFQVKIYPIDNWQEDYLELHFGGVVENLSKLSQDSSVAPSDLCGSPTISDLPPLLLFLNLTHTASTIDVKLTGMTETSSFGIREVVLTIYNEPIPTRPIDHPTCAVAPYTLNALSSGNDYSCPCEAPLTMPTPGTGYCSGCNSNCLLCHSTGPSGCIACNSTSYLTPSGQCANCTANCASCSGAPNNCVTCKAGYYIAGSSCYPECPDPLKRTQIGTKLFCQTDCNSGEYAYWDGTKTQCLSTCTPPLGRRVIASYAVCGSCAWDEYLDPDGNCKSKNLPGQISFTLRLNDTPTQVTFIDKQLQADNARFTLFTKDYTLNPTWTFFGLNSMGEYSIDNWDTNSNCGCFKQLCGRECLLGIECYDNSADVSSTPFICNDQSTRKNYCWSLIHSGTEIYTSYTLTHLATIALTSYGGPDGVFVSPGFTISTRLSNQRDALNAIIMNYTPRQQLDLTASYRYVEHLGRVVTTQYFANMNTKPKITADLKTAFCNATTINLPLSLTYQKEEKAPSFHVYSILRKAEASTLTYLNDQDILTPNGVSEWNNQETFDILDPCNQQFFTLRKDTMGNFFVYLPAFQTFSNPDSIICIAINDVPNSQYDLVLYELKNGSSVWSASDRFVGLLSRDYVEELTFRMATKANNTLIAPDLSVRVEFHTDVDDAYVQIYTTVPIASCKVELSAACSFTISTSSDYLYAKYPISNCGYLYEKAGYNCEGLVGYFYPPNNLVKTPTSQFTENTASSKTLKENFSVSKTIVDEQSFLHGLFSLAFWTRWSWESAPTKLTDPM